MGTWRCARTRTYRGCRGRRSGGASGARGSRTQRRAQGRRRQGLPLRRSAAAPRQPLTSSPPPPPPLPLHAHTQAQNGDPQAERADAPILVQARPRQQPEQPRLFPARTPQATAPRSGGTMSPRLATRRSESTVAAATHATVHGMHARPRTPRTPRKASKKSMHRARLDTHMSRSGGMVYCRRDKKQCRRRGRVVCSLLPPPPGVVDSRGKGTVTGARAAAHSPAPALLPHIIGLPTMLHATRTLNKHTNLGIRFDAHHHHTINHHHGVSGSFEKRKGDQIECGIVDLG